MKTLALMVMAMVAATSVVLAQAQSDQDLADRCQAAGQTPADTAYCIEQLRQAQRRDRMRDLDEEQSRQRLDAERQQQELNRNRFILQPPAALAPPTIPGIGQSR